MKKQNVIGLGELKFAIVNAENQVSSLHLTEESAEHALYVAYPVNQGYHAVELIDKIGYKQG